MTFDLWAAMGQFDPVHWDSDVGKEHRTPELPLHDPESHLQSLYVHILHAASWRHRVTRAKMNQIRLTRKDFLADRQGKTFADVVNDPDQPFEAVLAYFNQVDRQRRMDESELHHNRPPLAGVVRELEAQPEIDRFLAGVHVRRSARFRQAIGVLVRMIMERRGWQKTGRKGSLGVRASHSVRTPAHNTGGLAFWFIRAERYERQDGTRFRSVKERGSRLSSTVKNKQPSTTNSGEP